MNKKLAALVVLAAVVVTSTAAIAREYFENDAPRTSHRVKKAPAPKKHVEKEQCDWVAQYPVSPEAKRREEVRDYFNQGSLNRLTAQRTYFETFEVSEYPRAGFVLTTNGTYVRALRNH